MACGILRLISVLVLATRAAYCGGHQGLLDFHELNNEIDKTKTVARSIFVNPNGLHDFRSVQEAIDSIPANNAQWTRVHVAAGIYREKVQIPFSKRFILLEGEGREETHIEWQDYTGAPGIETKNSATFACNASDFVARNITFRNTFNGVNKTVPGVAAQVAGDRSAFYNCGFIGVQDTLSDEQGRHYYENCFIEGAVDFIFGYGQSIFQGCTLWTCKVPPGKAPGSITAQGRRTEMYDNGFVFRECTVDGVTPVLLGRVWGPYARVIFYRTNMSGIVVNKGWDIWKFRGSEGTVRLVESDCTGEGSNRTGRVPWSRSLSARQVARFTDLSYVNADGWLEAQPH